MINFADIGKLKGFTECIHTKIISNETEYGSFEDPIIMHRTRSNEKTPVSEIPSIINDENVIIAPRQ